MRIACPLIAGFVLVACANTFSTTYKGTGPASEAMSWAKRAQERYEQLEASASPEEKNAISSVRVFVDSIPNELAVADSTVGVREGSGAKLLGKVHVIAQLKAPDAEEAIPTLQMVAYAAGANLAYCPVEGLGHNCYLVRAAEPATQ